MNITKKSIKLSLTGLAAAAVASSMLAMGTAAPASATESSPTTSSSSSPTTSAEFFVRGAVTVGARAEASAVAYNGITVTAGHLLEEERTVTTNVAIKYAKVPTKAEIDQYGTVVHSQQEGQAVAAKEVAAYDKVLNKAKKQVAKAQLKLKHGSDRAKAKKQLKQAKKHLKQVQTSYKFIPLIVLARNTEFQNSGRRNRNELQPVADRVDGDDQQIVTAYIPSVRDFIIVAHVKLNGSVVEGCHNYIAFVIAPGTPDRSLYLIVQDATKIDLQVLVAYYYTIRLEVYGKLQCPDGTVKEDTKIQDYAFSDTVSKTVPGNWDVTPILRFGEEQVRYDKVLQRNAEASIAGVHSEQLGASMKLECPPAKSVRSGEITKYSKHYYPSDTVLVEMAASSSTYGNAVTIIPTIINGQIVTGDSRYPQQEYTAGNSRVKRFYIRPTGTVGSNLTIIEEVQDQDGKNEVHRVSSPILAEEL